MRFLNPQEAHGFRDKAPRKQRGTGSGSWGVGSGRQTPSEVTTSQTPPRPSAPHHPVTVALCTCSLTSGLPGDTVAVSLRRGALRSVPARSAPGGWGRTRELPGSCQAGPCWSVGSRVSPLPVPAWVTQAAPPKSSAVCGKEILLKRHVGSQASFCPLILISPGLMRPEEEQSLRAFFSTSFLSCIY